MFPEPHKINTTSAVGQQSDLTYLKLDLRLKTVSPSVWLALGIGESEMVRHICRRLSHSCAQGGDNKIHETESSRRKLKAAVSGQES